MTDNTIIKFMTFSKNTLNEFFTNKNILDMIPIMNIDKQTINQNKMKLYSSPYRHLFHNCGYHNDSVYNTQTHQYDKVHVSSYDHNQFETIIAIHCFDNNWKQLLVELYKILKFRGLFCFIIKSNI